jgi:hypothetical protein
VDIFRPDRERLRGFVEHANTPGRFVAWSVSTLGWTVAPWVFWRRVTVFVAPSAPRMLLWLLLCILAVYLVGSVLAVGAFGAWCLASPSVRQWDGLYALAVAASPFFGLEPWTNSVAFDPTRVLRVRLPVFAFAITWPLIFLVLRQTLRACRIRRVHVARAGVYSFAWLVWFALLRVLDQLWMLLAAFGAAARPVPPSAYLRGLLINPNSAALVWMAVWWWFAINRGFGLRHGFWVWALFLLAAALAAWITALQPFVWWAARYS